VPKPRRLIAIVLDRSGSMQAVRNDTEGGLRAFLAEQADVPAKTRVTLTQFDNEYEVIYTARKLD
jgi:predicted metal-dependent peptidase